MKAAASLRSEKVEGQDHDELVKKSRTRSVPVPPMATRRALGFLAQWLSLAIVVALIFGGCCSNVYALEAIVNSEPESGTLLTFVQFLFVAVTGYVSQLDPQRPPFFLRPNKVPIRRWLVNIVLFFLVNLLNNHAFSYDISVPVHIILRSGGSITTMAIGWVYGKKYSRVQVSAVCLLTVGVVMAAWSDAGSKGTSSTASGSERPSFMTGLLILFIAQLLSALMGLYTEETYKEYGPQWRENLFYSHILSLPLFLPFLPSLLHQFQKLSMSPPLSPPSKVEENLPELYHQLEMLASKIPIPRQMAYLVANVLTQYACIRGVNLLAAASSALTVTIVLNIRKLVSLLLSIWLFGNKLAPGTLLGAVIVFGAGGLYSLDSQGRRTKSKQQ